MYKPFKLPGYQTNLASPFYWIGVTGSYRFHKPVQVEFEHFAVVTACDPSHYQLLHCEDDDKSHIMKPIDCDLTLDNSWCTFSTDHFCSYCLFHNCEHPMITRIGIFFLKPKNFQFLNKFTVEVWFSFNLRNCMKRNEELYKKRGMILDSACSDIFEAPSDRNSTNYLELSYSQMNDGWSIDHTRREIIETKEVNFYNYYNDTLELKANEERSLFPPRFIVNVAKIGEHNIELNTTIAVTLCNNTEKIKYMKCRLHVPVLTGSMKSYSSIPKDNSLPSVGFYHCDNCDHNKPVLKDLVQYATKISSSWEQIAVQLDISQYEVDVIERNHPNDVERKCYDMFKFWLQSGKSPCWCRFVQSLRMVGLNDIAEEAETHLRSSYSNNTSSTTSVTPQPKMNGDQVKLDQFLGYLKDISAGDWKLFVLQLLSRHSALDVIRDIRRSGGIKKDNMSRIYRAFLNEKDTSWTKVHQALKEANYDELAETIETCFF